MSWKGKKFGGWAASCDLMPPANPFEEPVGDIATDDTHEPKDYVIIDKLNKIRPRS